MIATVTRGTTHDLEGLLRALAVAGATALIAALAVVALGTATRTLAPVYGASLRFLVAVLIVTAPYADLLERRARRLRRIPLDQRLGFAPSHTG